MAQTAKVICLVNYLIFFLIFARGIHCGEFSLSFFGGGNKKIMYAPVKPQFYYITFGCEGIKSIQACCRDEDWQYYDHTMPSCKGLFV